MPDFSYTKLLNCQTPEEVRRVFVEWSSNKSEQEHLIRSSILDLHATVEQNLKKVLFEILYDAMPIYDSKKDESNRSELEKVIRKINFSSVYRLLKPCLNAFPEPDLKNIEAINQCRNLVAHGDIELVTYKGKNPFKDSECLAQFYVDYWAVNKTLRKFLGRMILGPRSKALFYEEYYYKQKGHLK